LKLVLSLAVGVSMLATSLAWADGVALPQPVSKDELGAERGGAPSPTGRAQAAIAGAQGSDQSSGPSAAAVGAAAVLNNGIGGPLGGNGGLHTILGGQIIGGSRSFGQ
jgi:hypothetical protein